jgi:hypothetical protein
MLTLGNISAWKNLLQIHLKNVENYLKEFNFAKLKLLPHWLGDTLWYSGASLIRTPLIRMLHLPDDCSGEHNIWRPIIFWFNYPDDLFIQTIFLTSDWYDSWALCTSCNTLWVLIPTIKLSWYANAVTHSKIVKRKIFTWILFFAIFVSTCMFNKIAKIQMYKLFC